MIIIKNNNRMINCSIELNIIIIKINESNIKCMYKV